MTLAPRILADLTEGPGYSTGLKLGGAELAAIRGMITRQYLDRFGRREPRLVSRAAELGIENYHQLPIGFDHGGAWPKESRLLPVAHVTDFMQMGFFREIE